jgi:ATP-dependent Clp protease ATP-binding subunit ClpC
MNGYNFTERVRKVLTLARAEAMRLRHEYVGTEHILLGLIREGEGVASTALGDLVGDPEILVARVEQSIQPGKHRVALGDLPYTSRAKKVLEFSMTAARSLDHAYVGTEHVLLGLIAEGKGIAAQVLTEAGVTADAARAEILRLLGGSEPEREPTPSQQYEALGPARGRPIERVEVILHYRDGQLHEASFTSARDAAGFLLWSTPRPR